MKLCGPCRDLMSRVTPHNHCLACYCPGPPHAVVAVVGLSSAVGVSCSVSGRQGGRPAPLSASQRSPHRQQALGVLSPSPFSDELVLAPHPPQHCWVCNASVRGGQLIPGSLVSWWSPWLPSCSASSISLSLLSSTRALGAILLCLQPLAAATVVSEGPGGDLRLPHLPLTLRSVPLPLDERAHDAK